LGAFSVVSFVFFYNVKQKEKRNVQQSYERNGFHIAFGLHRISYQITISAFGSFRVFGFLSIGTFGSFR
jgi:hypothetical protein